MQAVACQMLPSRCLGQHAGAVNCLKYSKASYKADEVDKGVSCCSES
jgi:hypothetical protein